MEKLFGNYEQPFILGRGGWVRRDGPLTITRLVNSGKAKNSAIDINLINLFINVRPSG